MQNDRAPAAVTCRPSGRGTSSGHSEPAENVTQARIPATWHASTAACLVNASPPRAPTGRLAQAACIAIGVATAIVPLRLCGQATRDTAQATVDTPSPSPAARPADVDSIGAILRAAYDAISGPAGPRDWQRFRSLFIPGGRLIPAGCDTAGHCRIRVVSFNQYALNAAPFMLKHPFYEKEIGRKVDTFGSVAQVSSTSASRHEANDPQPFARGINSFQLFYDGTRWYIVTIYWNAERKGLQIPSQYLNEPD